MTRKSKVDRLGLGPKIQAYVQSGMTNEQVLRQLRHEHPELTFSASALSRYLTKNPMLTQEESIVIADAHQSLVRTTLSSIESVRQALEDTINEVLEKSEELRDDPKGLAVYLQLRINALKELRSLLAALPRTEQAPFAIARDQNDPICRGCFWYSHMSIQHLRDLLEEDKL